MLLALLTLVMMLSLLTTAAFAEQGDQSGADAAADALTEAEMGYEVIVPDLTQNNESNSQLLDDYARQELERALMEKKGEIVSGQSILKEDLSELQTAIYTQLKSVITEIAEGSRTSTEYTLYFTDDFIATHLTWTADQINGVDSITAENYAEAGRKAAGQYINSSLIHEALLNTLPYELYWYDKMKGMPSGLYSQFVTLDNGDTAVRITGLTFAFYVAQEYSETGTVGTHTVDGNVGGQVRRAIQNAQNLVDSFKSFSDTEKLMIYKNYICKEVSYNDDAVTDSYDLGYGNPWQLIWVFDGDPNTNVVCEGYAKAFAYLCDLSDFSSDSVNCYTVSGTMAGGTGSGPHMWNVIAMDDGANYLVDVTNCDGLTVGEPDLLFLKGGSAGTVNMQDGEGNTFIEDCFVFNCNNTNVYYIYDQETKDYYTAGQLAVSAADYVFPEPVERPVLTLTVNGESETVTGVEGKNVTLLIRAPGATGVRLWYPTGEGGGYWEYFDSYRPLNYLEIKQSYYIGNWTLYAMACYDEYEGWVGDADIAWTVISNEVLLSVPEPTETLTAPSVTLNGKTDPVTVTQGDWLRASITGPVGAGEGYQASVYKKDDDVNGSEGEQYMPYESYYVFDNENVLYLPPFRFEPGDYKLGVYGCAPGYKNSPETELFFAVRETDEGEMLPTGLLLSRASAAVQSGIEFLARVPGAEHMQIEIARVGEPDWSDSREWQSGEVWHDSLWYDEPGDYELTLTAWDADNQVVITDEATVTFTSQGQLTEPDLSTFPRILESGENFAGVIGVDENATNLDIHISCTLEINSSGAPYEDYRDVYYSNRSRSDGEGWTTLSLPADLFTQAGRYQINVSASAVGYEYSHNEFVFLRRVDGTQQGTLFLTVNGSAEDIPQWNSGKDLNVRVSSESATAVRFLRPDGNFWDYQDLGSHSASWRFGCGDGDYTLVAQMTTDTPDWRADDFDWGNFSWESLNWTDLSNVVVVHVTSPYGRLSEPELTVTRKDGSVLLEGGEVLRGDRITLTATYQLPQTAENQEIREWIWAELMVWETTEPDYPSWHTIENYGDGSLQICIPTIQLEPGSYSLQLGMGGEGMYGRESTMHFTVTENPNPPAADLVFSRNSIQTHEGVRIDAHAPGAESISLEIRREDDPDWRQDFGYSGDSTIEYWGTDRSGTYLFTLTADYDDGRDPAQVTERLEVTSEGSMNAPILNGVPVVHRLNQDISGITFTEETVLDGVTVAAERYDVELQWNGMMLLREERDATQAGANEINLDASWFSRPGAYQLIVSVVRTGYESGRSEVWFPVLAAESEDSQLALSISREKYDEDLEDNECLLYQNVRATLAAPENVTAARVWTGRDWLFMEKQNAAPGEGANTGGSVFVCEFGVYNEGPVSFVAEATESDLSGAYTENFDWSNVVWKNSNTVEAEVVCYGTLSVSDLQLVSYEDGVLKGDELTLRFTGDPNAYAYGIMVVPEGGYRYDVVFSDEYRIPEGSGVQGSYALPTADLKEGNYTLILDARCYGWRSDEALAAFTVYVDQAALFRDFKEACESENPPEQYEKLRNLDEFTVSESLTIPAGMFVESWGTTMIIPEGVTLTVAGDLNGSGIRVEQGGMLKTWDNTGNDWANIYVDELLCNGTVQVRDHSNVNIDALAWSEALADTLSFEGDEAWFRLQASAFSDGELQEGVAALQVAAVPASVAEHVKKNMNVNYDCTLADGSLIREGIEYYVHNNAGDQYGSLVIPEGVMVTVNPGDRISMLGCGLTVQGSLVNNGRISLEPGDGNNRFAVADLTVVDSTGGSYSGGGIIEINAPENPRGQIRGIPETRILTLWNDSNSDWSGYRIVAEDPTVISDGDSFLITTAADEILPGQYSGSKLITPQESGFYTFTVRFEGDPIVQEGQAQVGIIGTPVGDRNLVTENSASMVVGTTLTVGEGYEFVLANDETLGTMTATVTVGKISGLGDILASLAGTEESYTLTETTAIADGETLTVPAKVQLRLRAQLFVANGGRLINESNITVETPGELTVANGGTLELRDTPAEEWSASVILDGGRMNAAGNVDYDDNSLVVIDCWSYENVNAALGFVSGVPSERLNLNLNVSSVEELFGLNGSPTAYWNDLSGYGGVTFNLNNRLNLMMNNIGIIPDNYLLIVNSGTSLKNPVNNTLTLNGGIVLEGGTLDNSGTMNVNNWINFQRSYSTFRNSGTLNVNNGGWIGANSMHEKPGSGTIQNTGLVNVLAGGVITPEITVMNNALSYENVFVLPAGTRIIAEEAFAGTNAQEIDLPEGIGSIADRAFANSDSLSLVVIPARDVTITGNPFQDSPNVRITAPPDGNVQSFAEREYIPFLPLT